MGEHGRLLTLDSDLGGELPGERRDEANEALGVRLEQVRPGDWRPAAGDLGAEGGIGLLIVRGFMLRRIALEHRAGGEVLGPGDLLRPWQDDGEHAVYPFSAGWRVLDTLTVAVLDRELAARLGPYPEVTAALVGRAMDRSRRIAGHLVLAQLASVEHRVLVGLWHLADEWGRVTRDGIRLPIGLTHEQLGLIVGARRPSVSTALGRLDAQGRVHHFEPGGFLLTGDPPDGLPLLRGSGRGDGALAPSLDGRR